MLRAVAAVPPEARRWLHLRRHSRQTIQPDKLN
jgi:hypothetical protein